MFSITWPDPNRSIFPFTTVFFVAMVCHPLFSPVRISPLDVIHSRLSYPSVIVVVKPVTLAAVGHDVFGDPPATLGASDHMGVRHAVRAAADYALVVVALPNCHRYPFGDFGILGHAHLHNDVWDVICL